MKSYLQDAHLDKHLKFIDFFYGMRIATVKGEPTKLWSYLEQIYQIYSETL